MYLNYFQHSDNVNRVVDLDSLWANLNETLQSISINIPIINILALPIKNAKY